VILLLGGRVCIFIQNYQDSFIHHLIEYIGDNVTKSHRLFKNSKSFVRLVSNYFNTFEVKKEGNGGSDGESLEFIDNLFDN
jgi:hypothetical protein